MSIEFGDLPPSKKESQFGVAGSRKLFVQSVGRELQQRPGEWARVYTVSAEDAGSGDRARSSRTNMVTAFAAEFGSSIECAKRGDDVWARWIS